MFEHLYGTPLLRPGVNPNSQTEENLEGPVS
jgi:hypothetical protein